jgi:hypothetical protein
MTTPLWWLSFVDPDRQEGDRFLGGCVVRARGLVDASRAAWTAGCNPGGEMAGYEMPREHRDMIKPADIGKLMNREECERFAS